VQEQLPRLFVVEGPSGQVQVPLIGKEVKVGLVSGAEANSFLYIGYDRSGRHQTVLLAVQAKKGYVQSLPDQPDEIGPIN
jgi:hypothetical protein